MIFSSEIRSNWSNESNWFLIKIFKKNLNPISTKSFYIISDIRNDMVSNITLDTRNIPTVSKLRPHIEDYVTIY